MSDKPVKPGYQVIYRPYITTKSGKRIYAHQKGLRAFRLEVKIKDEK